MYQTSYQIVNPIINFKTLTASIDDAIDHFMIVFQSRTRGLSALYQCIHQHQVDRPVGLIGPVDFLNNNTIYKCKS